MSYSSRAQNLHGIKSRSGSDGSVFSEWKLRRALPEIFSREEILIPVTAFLLMGYTNTCIDYVVGPTRMAAWVAICLFGALGIYFYRISPMGFLLAAMLFLGQAGAMASNLAIEGGNWSLELGRWGYATGSTTRLGFYNLLFFATLLISSREGLPRVTPRHQYAHCNSVDRSLFYILVAVVFSAATFDLIKWGVPLLEGLNRFARWLDHPYPVFKQLHYQTSLVCFLAGRQLAISSCNTDRYGAWIVFLASLFILILYSHRFSQLSEVAYVFAVGYWIPTSLSGKGRIKVRQVVMWAGIGLIILAGLLPWHYELTEANSSQDFGTFLTERFCEQGGIWWAIDELAQQKQGPIDMRIAELIDNLRKTASHTFPGVQILMESVLSVHDLEGHLEQSSNVSMGYPAIGLYLFGYSGLAFVQVTVGVLLARFWRCFSRSLLLGGIIECALAFKIFLAAELWFTTGNFQHLLRPSFWLYIFVLLWLWKRKSVQNGFATP